MGTKRWSLHFSLIAAAALASACEPTTAPNLGLDFDDEAALSAYEAMDSLFASRSLDGFRALDGRTPFSSPAAAAAIAVLADGSPSEDGGRAFALGMVTKLHGAALSADGPAAAPIISESHRGVTFVYDPVAGQYAAAPERDGAPPTGVRFVLYEVDEAADPIVDQEIGYADLVDEGDESAQDVSLRLTVVVHEATVLEYRTTVDVQIGRGTLTVHGALQEPGGPRLDFDIEATGTSTEAGGTLDVAFDLRLDARGFSVTGTVRGVEDGDEGEGDVELVVRHGDDSVRLSVTGGNGEIDGSVFVNGSLFATVTGDASDPVVASATGEPLTFRQMLVLHRIVDGVEDVFDFLEDLLDPVDELVILAIIL